MAVVRMRTFDELRGGGSDWCTSLAYWLGVYSGKSESSSLLEVGSALSYQYDFEEQADCYGSALPEDQAWAEVFFPVAPIQLASGWSPLPRAIDVLGQPRVETLEDGAGTRMVAVAWEAATIWGVKTTARHSSSADERRFLGLLTVAVTRAQATQLGLLLVAKPGWSYEHVHEVSKKTDRLMSKAGFVVTTRRP